MAEGSKQNRNSISAAEVAEGLENYSRAGEGWVARCPAHDDDEPSLSIRDGDNGVPLLKCHAGCSNLNVIAELCKLNLWYDSPQKEKPKAKSPPKQYKQDAVYDYTDEDGVLVCQTVRYVPKRFKQRVVNEDGSFTWSLKGVEQFYPYRVRQFHLTDRKDDQGMDRAICLFEGERDADLACDMGILGTTLPMGAGKWRDEYTQYFSGRRVYIFEDDDTTGHNHANMIADRLHHVCKDNIKVISLPNPKNKKGYDFSDWVEDGGTKELLTDIITETPLWTIDTIVEKHRPDNVIPFKNGKATRSVPMVPKDKVNLYWDEMRPHLATKPDGSIDAKSLSNADIFLRHHPDMVNRLGWHERRNMPFMREFNEKGFPWDNGREGNERPLNNYDANAACIWLEGHGIKLGTSQISIAMESIAYDNPFDKLAEYLEALVWDGQPRIRRMFETYFGAFEEGISRIISEKFMVGAVARAFRPGCQMDNMLVLEGPQGIRKSTGLSILFGQDNFCDQLPSLSRNADAAMQLAGHWCVEVQEFHTMNQADHNRIKEFLSVKIDTYRPPYGRHVIHVPRGCVMVGTINPEGGYLRDPTGARRFWPVACSKVDTEKLADDRDQLWAEAVDLYRRGAVNWWIDREDKDDYDAIGNEQASRFSLDVWGEDIAHYMLERGSAGATITDVLRDGLKLDSAQLTPQAQKRARGVLSFLGYEQKRSNGKRVYKRMGTK